MTIVPVALFDSPLCLSGAEKLDFRVKTFIWERQLRGNLLIGGYVGKRRRVIRSEIYGGLMDHWVYRQGRDTTTPLSVELTYLESERDVVFNIGPAELAQRYKYSTSTEVAYAELADFLQHDLES